MRPVLKSTISPTVFSKYGNAKPYLCNQLGKYCSYCEIPLPIASLEVEHLLYKDGYPTFALNWANFLLSCKNCNTIKKIKDLRSIAIFLPHLHNLLCYLDINQSIVIVKPNLGSQETQKAQAFIDLCGLDKIDTSDRDDRWEHRMKAFDIAIEERNMYALSPSSRHIDYILKLATLGGFFSAWFMVFEAYPEVRQALIEAFEGTDNTCFDVANRYEPLPRFLDDSGLLLAQ